jgi:hypothetical protein
MKSSEKKRKTEEFDLDRCLPLSRKDIAQMAKPVFCAMELGAYLEFLEDIKAFEQTATNRPSFDGIFELPESDIRKDG